MKKIAVFNHGKDSSPNSPKIGALSKIASDYGYDIESVDYTAQIDPDKRVKQLLALDFSEFQRVLLVGSSMWFVRVQLDTGEWEVLVTSLRDERLYPSAEFSDLYYFR